MVGLWALMEAADSYWNVQVWRITCTWNPKLSWGEHVHATPTSHVTGERYRLPWTSTGSRRLLREIWHCEGTSMIVLPSPCPLLAFALLHVTFLCPQGREQPSHHVHHHCCLGTWLLSGLVLFSISSLQSSFFIVFFLYFKPSFSHPFPTWYSATELFGPLFPMPYVRVCFPEEDRNCFKFTALTLNAYSYMG